MNRRGRPPQVPEEIELQIFDLHNRGMNKQQISRQLGVPRETVRDIIFLGEPRWRHLVNGEWLPSPAVIAWHCRQHVAKWSEVEKGALHSKKYEAPTMPEDIPEAAD